MKNFIIILFLIIILYLSYKKNIDNFENEYELDSLISREPFEV